MEVFVPCSKIYSIAELTTAILSTTEREPADGRPTTGQVDGRPAVPAKGGRRQATRGQPEAADGPKG
eukprot:1912347-Amphidinium_carterae.1